MIKIFHKLKFDLNLETTLNYTDYSKQYWKCVRNGNELVSHVIGEKREECEKDREGYRRIEKDRKGQRRIEEDRKGYRERTERKEKA